VANMAVPAAARVLPNSLLFDLNASLKEGRRGVGQMGCNWRMPSRRNWLLLLSIVYKNSVASRDLDDPR
jgi:hypothetical protein